MDIKELNKTQLILLSLLITFVVSIATGIVTVSLMQQMPKSVPQTINNVIQRTIEKVTTVEVPVATKDDPVANKQNVSFLGDGNVLVSIYPAGEAVATPIIGGEEGISIPESTEAGETTTNTGGAETKPESPKVLGQGIIISDVGLILVESSILDGYEKYKVVLNKTDFEVTILKKFGNGFTVLKIATKQDKKNTENNKENTSEVTPKP